jgi:hypothetical protein
VAGKEQDMAVEIIIQIGDREFWKQFDDMKSYMKLSYQIILDELRKRLQQFVVANAVVHLDEDSPHMHIVGVPVADGYKKGLCKQVSKRKVFKELIKEGLCWFPRLMRWKTSKGEVAPAFLEKSDGYSYSLYGYMNVDTKEYYSKKSIQWEITAGNSTGTVEQMDANVEAMVRDLKEILRIVAEQKRLWEVYNK